METQKDKISYILGRQVGNDMKNQGIDIDANLFTEGLMGLLSGEESKLSQEDEMSTMESWQKQMQEKAQEFASQAGEENMQAGIDFLENNKTQDGVSVTDSGLQYKVLTQGSGKSPSAESEVETHYEGKLIDGTVFDSSYQRGQTTTFPVNRVIAGWTEALQLMQEGDVWELAIPSALAYGSQGAGAQIGPNAALIFKVELVKVL